MFGSAVLEVVLSLIFVYFILGQIGSVFQIFYSKKSKLRETTLRRAIRTLLSDPDGLKLSAEFYQHPLIEKLTAQRDGIPDDIPPKIFAQVVLDLIDEEHPKKFERFWGKLNSLENKEVKRAILTLIDDIPINNGNLPDGKSTKDANRKADEESNEGNGEDKKTVMILARIESWFKNSEPMLTKLYKTEVQKFVFYFALFASLVLNIDTFAIAKGVWENANLRLTFQQEVSAQVGTPSLSGKEPKTQQAPLKAQGFYLPIGWGAPENRPDNLLQFLIKCLGWLFTAAAVSLGATFWFDMLNKISGVRTKVREIEKEMVGGG